MFIQQISLLVFLILLSTMFIKSRYFEHKTLSKKTWLIIFGIKSLVGFFFYYYFTQINFNPQAPSDVFRFFQEAKWLNEVFYQSPSAYFKFLTGIGDSGPLIKHYLPESFLWDAGNSTFINDSRILIRVHSIIYFISCNNPYNHILIINFFTTFALFKLVKAIEPFSKFKPIVLIILLGLYPNILFWFSSPLKESFVFIGISFLLHYLLIDYRNSKFHLNGFIGLIVLICFKPYVLICALPGLLFFQIQKHYIKKIIPAFVITLALLICPFLITPFKNKVVNDLSIKQFHMMNTGRGGIHIFNNTNSFFILPNEYHKATINTQYLTLNRPCYLYATNYENKLYPTKIYYTKTPATFKIQTVMPKSNSYFQSIEIANNSYRFVKAIPEAIVNTFIRPFPNSPIKISDLFYFSFNCLLIISVILSLLHRNKTVKNHPALLISIGLFVISLSILIGLTTPISGLIVRYKTPIEVALILIICLSYDRNRIWKKTTY